MLHNIRQNPLSYTLAFCGAIIWALYCNVTRKYAGAIMGTSYAAWNISIIQGNMTLLATASYFTLVFSEEFASLWLVSI